MIRLCQKKQNKLCNILGVQDSSDSINSSKISDDSILTSQKLFKQTISTIPETMKTTSISEYFTRKPTKSHFALGPLLGKGRYGSVYISK